MSWQVGASRRTQIGSLSGAGPMGAHERRRASFARPSMTQIVVIGLSLFDCARAGTPESVIGQSSIRGDAKDITGLIHKLREEALAAGEELLLCPVLEEIQLEIRPSNIPGAGLGVFLSPSFPLTIPAGCPVTSYGGKLMAHQDVKDFVYALRVGNETDVLMMGKPWDGPVPANVSGSTAVGHLCNDAAAVLVSDESFTSGAPDLGPGMVEEGKEASRELREVGVLSMARMHRLVEAYYAETVARSNVGFEGTGVEDADLSPCHLATDTRAEQAQGAEGGGASNSAVERRIACVSEALGRAGGSWVMAASQDITPGQELYYTYGHRYWLRQLMEEGQLKNSLQLLWVERYLAENGDLVESPEGFLYLDGYGRLIDSKTEKEADEQRCKDMMSGVLRWEGQSVEVRQHVMDTVGIRAGMTNKEALEKMYEYTVDASL